jgi:hypothetical protein
MLFRQVVDNLSGGIKQFLVAEWLSGGHGLGVVVGPVSNILAAVTADVERFGVWVVADGL